MDLTPRYFVADFPVATADDFFDANVLRRDGEVGVSLNPNGPGSIDGDGLTGRLFNSSDRVEVIVPRSFLDDPRWVRIGSATGVVRNDTQDRDDARLDGGAVAFPATVSEKCLFGD